MERKDVQLQPAGEQIELVVLESESVSRLFLDKEQADRLLNWLQSHI